MAEASPLPGSQDAVRAATAALDAARRAWESGVSEARRQLANAEKAHGEEVGQQEKAVEKRRKPHAIGRVGAVSVYDDHIEVEGRHHPLHPGVMAAVDVGSKGKVFLRIQGPEWSEVVELDEKREATARRLAAEIDVTSANAERARAARSADIARMEQALADLRANTVQVDQARRVLAAAEANTADLESACDALDAQLNAATDPTARWYRQAVTRLGRAREAAGISAPTGSKAAAAFTAGGGGRPFWRQWTSGWRLAVAAVAGLLIVLTVVGIIVGGDDTPDEQESAAAATVPTMTTSGAQAGPEAPPTSTADRAAAERQAAAKEKARRAARARADARAQARRQAAQRRAAAQQRARARGTLVEGSGARVIPVQLADDGPVVVEASHRGGANFIVKLVGRGLDELLVNEIGSYAGTVVAPEVLAGRYRMAIEADGPWSIRYRQPEPTTRAQTLLRTFQGQGSAVIPVRSTEDLEPIISGRNTGSSNFIVSLIAYGDEVTGRELLFNEIGPYGGETLTRIPVGDYLLAVQAEGQWSIRSGGSGLAWPHSRPPQDRCAAKPRTGLTGQHVVPQSQTERRRVSIVSGSLST